MKNIILKSVVLFALSIFLIAPNANAEQTKKPKKVITTEISVDGCCSDCKDRIEGAVDIKGVKYAVWNLDDKKLTITYSTKKTSLEEIEKRIAIVGHDTENFKANKEAYNALPACCHYKDKEGCQH